MPLRLLPDQGRAAAGIVTSNPDRVASLQEILQAWRDLGVGPTAAVQPVPDDLVEGLGKFRDLATAIVRPGADELSSRVALAAAGCIGYLLDDRIELDEVYLDLTRELFRLVPSVLGGDGGEAEATQVLERLGVLQELYGPKPRSLTSEPRRKFLGEYLIELGHVTQDDLDKALAAQQSGDCPGLRMGDILQKWGTITRAQLDEAIERQMVDQYEM